MDDDDMLSLIPSIYAYIYISLNKNFEEINTPE